MNGFMIQSHLKAYGFSRCNQGFQIFPDSYDERIYLYCTTKVVPYQFKRFDVVSDDSDHRFLKSQNGDDCFSNATSGVYKRIMKEWRILDQNLPESIYVRVFEKRIDLLTAAIVGAVGTPYHDGLFFFDVAFPPD
ncbi:hypothetical protein L6164_011966 [Bauhinia variegata]|uniref:Uncharacterized protein n=1 Tax=Bauhinia variegata TaxID=167791 RepID=A0ACB9PBG7_BAUVA|nr:hypothetical protein L6164_011966 [Bauhinia variegata]